MLHRFVKTITGFAADKAASREGDDDSKALEEIFGAVGVDMKAFFEMEPGFNTEGFTAYQNSFSNETFNALIDQIKALNKEIAEDSSLGRGFQIGHSYFCGREETGCTEEWMRAVVEFDIIPMLSEYWFDEPAKLKRWENNLRGVFDD